MSKITQVLTLLIYSNSKIKEEKGAIEKETKYHYVIHSRLEKKQNID